MKIIFIVTALLILALSGCVQLTQKGSQVSLTKNQERIKNCKFKGNVDRKSPIMVGGAGGRDIAENNAKNEAAKMGGNIIFLAVEFSNYTDSRVSGEVYHCKL